MLLAMWALYSRSQVNAPPAVMWAVIAGFLAFFVLIFWAAARARRKRREALEQFAMESGFAFTAEADPSLTQELSAVQLTVPIAAPRVKYENVLRGSRQGRDIIIANRTSGQGKSQSQTTVVAIKLQAPVPPFYLCAENFLFHIFEKLGFNDIDLDSAPEFSRRFFLHSDKPDEVRALFTTDVTLVFEQLPQDAALCVQGAGHWLAVYRGTRLTPPDQLREIVDIAARIADALHRGEEAAAKW